MQRSTQGSASVELDLNGSALHHFHTNTIVASHAQAVMLPEMMYIGDLKEM